MSTRNENVTRLRIKCQQLRLQAQLAEPQKNLQAELGRTQNTRKSKLALKEKRDYMWVYECVRVCISRFRWHIQRDYSRFEMINKSGLFRVVMAVDCPFENRTVLFLVDRNMVFSIAWWMHYTVCTHVTEHQLVHKLCKNRCHQVVCSLSTRITERSSTNTLRLHSFCSHIIVDLK